LSELDLTQADAKCSTDSASVRLMKKWLEIGEGNIKVIALKGIQTDTLEMWAQAMADKGVKILEKQENGDRVIYLVHLP
jgi:predicted metalloenzyme YecM